MFKTYKAHLKNNRLEWLEPQPLLPEGEVVKVHVTLLDDSIALHLPLADSQPVTHTVAGTLAALASYYEQNVRPGVAEDLFHTDPVAWQRQQRADRVLPGRVD